MQAGAGTSTDVTLSSRWEAGLEGATSPLLTFLQGMGAQQLCLRVVAGMAVPPPSAVDVLGDSFTGLTDKVRVHFCVLAVTALTVCGVC